MTRPDATSGEPATVENTNNFYEVLQKYNKKLLNKPLSDLLCEPDRFKNFSLRMDGLLLDYSRVHLDRAALDQLFALAVSKNVAQARDRLFRGESVNVTESRPAMHMALRGHQPETGIPDNELHAMRAAMQQMMEWGEILHQGKMPGASGGRVRNIIHIGIGGSLLGTQLLCDALVSPGGDAPQVHFIGSVDAHLREGLLPRLDPRETIVVLVSKSFTTSDTLMHGRRVIEWMCDALGEEGMDRVFAVTARAERAMESGVHAGRVLYLPEWVGGRYSLWSPVSLSAVAVSGADKFRELLRGASDMDRHFLEAEPAGNMPLLMGLLGVWHRNICGYASWGIIPYDQRLSLLPAHLQQLIMESNGKSIGTDGQPAKHETAPLVYGQCGTDAQHALFQAIHQGTDIMPLNLVGVIRPDHRDADAHHELLANMLAQATALAQGRTIQETAQLAGPGETTDKLAHRAFAGNRPTELLILDDLGPANLGRLLALYEHKVFVESVIWDINAFDQWGVELGKSLAPAIRRSLEEGSAGTPGLADLLDYIRKRS